MSYQAQLGPPLTLSQRVERLTNNLEVLRHKLKDAIAGAIGTAVADAVHDAVRGLLGSDVGQLGHQENHWPSEDERSWDNPRWNDPDDGMWRESHPFGQEPDFEDTSSNCTANIRIRNAIGAAWQTSLFWLRQQRSQRPVLTTSVVALAAGVTAFFWGPALATGVGVLASIAGLLMTSDSTSLTASSLTAIAPG